MNNFSELQGTDISLTLVLELEPHYNTHAPDVLAYANNVQLYSGKLTQICCITQQIPLKSIFDIQIHLINKNDLNDCTTGVIISSLTIDCHNLVPKWTHLAHYTNDRDYDGPAAHLGFNGVWKLTIDKPFYQWWHINTGQGWLLKPQF